jgi:ammonium transporter Rh
MLVSAIAIELNVVVELFCRFLYGMGGSDDTQLPLPLSVSVFTDGQFAAATLLISFGAVIGRATPTQLAIMALCQSFPYAFNKVVLVFGLWGAEDVGGTMTIHMFGALFGLSVSYAMGTPKEETFSNDAAKDVSDILAFIGTTLLWVYWPSFVGATETAVPEYEQNCLVHTILALLGSTLATFYMSPKLCHGKLDPVHIANSTLAGGVAVGSSARLTMTPGGALLIGIMAGVVSVYGYAYSTPYLEKSYRLFDTCGVGNLHGWPSIVGGLASAVFVLLDPDREFLARGMFQFLFQILGVLGTILVAVTSGYGTGLVMMKYGSLEVKPDEYDDAVWWEGPYFESGQ